MDYSAKLETIVFTFGQRQGSKFQIPISIKKDGIVELSQEMFFGRLMLESSMLNVTLSPDRASVVIEDDDGE